MAPTAGTILRMKKKGAKPAKKTRSLKNRIRAVTRLLKRPGISEDVRMQQQRELESLREKSELNLQTEHERILSLKYRKKRFFDRRKLMRLLKKVDAEISKTIDEIQRKQLCSEKEKLEDDMKYVRFFPRGEKYITLFPKTNHNDKTLEKIVDLRKEAIQLAVQYKKDGREDDTLGVLKSKDGDKSLKDDDMEQLNPEKESDSELMEVDDTLAASDDDDGDC